MDNRTLPVCWRQPRLRASASLSSRRSSHGPTAPSTWTPRPPGSRTWSRPASRPRTTPPPRGGYWRRCDGSCGPGATERPGEPAPAASAVAAGAGHARWLRRRLRMVRGAGAPSLPPGGGGGAFGPRRTREGGALRQSLRRAALPPLRAVHRVLDGGGGGTTSVVLAEAGHPLRPDGLRLRRPPRDVGRLPRGPLGPRPPGPAPRFLLHGRRRDTGGLAGVSRRTHPAGDIGEDSPGRHTPGRPRRRAERDRVRGGGAGRAPGSSPRPATSSSTTPTKTAITTASPTPGTTTSSRRARRSGARPSPSWTRWAS